LWVIWILVLLAGAAGAGVKFNSVRKDLAVQREAINVLWNAVSDALDKRADLAMELADAARRSTGRESEVLQDITVARASLSNAPSPSEKINANGRISAAVGKLLLQSENDRRLGKDEEFQRVQDELGEQDNEVAVARRKYNESLERYNTSIQIFPENLVAATSGIRRIDAYFKTETGPGSVPKGQF